LLVYTTQEIANLVGVTKRCILNWLRDGKIPEPERDRNRYRIWTQRELSNVLAYKQQRRQPERWGQHAKNRHSEP
jgi:excisionase family DNA binding protein